MTTRRLVSTLTTALILACAHSAWGQNFPGKRINIATSQAGGAGDFASRLIAQGLTAAIHQPVIIENRASIAPEYVAKAPPDGYTLLLYGNTVWISPLLRPVRWDAIKDFSPVMLTVRSPNVLVVTPTLPVNSVRELIALAKARPGEMNYAASALGSSTHLAAELFTVMAGVKIVRVNYKGVSMGITDVVSGQVQVMFLSPGAVTALIKSGKLRALAVTGTGPSALFPGLPTVAASGVPGYESSAYFGLFAPAKTPAAIIARLNQEVARVLNAPGVKVKFFDAGMEIVASSPEDFAAMLKSEITKWSRIIKKAGIGDQ
ncbi:MAG: tripartite tricarboxylate transporter substrate binding protein [Betaproteobacteria bacterium]|nr:tripartite tricarboxylate transporter substrate binding protein [Betaproteobacteria bacterium]